MILEGIERYSRQADRFSVEQTAAGEGERPRLQKAVKELEALFLYEMLKEMRKTAGGEGLWGKGLGADIYGSLFDMEMAKGLAERGTGLGEMILKQMEKGDGRRTPPPVAEPPSASPARFPSPLPAAQGGNSPEGERLGERDPLPERIFPARGRISSRFGLRQDPFGGGKEFHKGIDIAAEPGETVRSFQGGKVIFSGVAEGYGNVVVIDHGQGMISKYGHNAVNLVSTGEEVAPGQVVALVGGTGRATGPHLHFEVRIQGQAVDPLLWFPEGQKTVG